MCGFRGAKDLSIVFYFHANRRKDVVKVEKQKHNRAIIRASSCSKLMEVFSMLISASNWITAILRASQNRSGDSEKCTQPLHTLAFVFQTKNSNIPNFENWNFQKSKSQLTFWKETLFWTKFTLLLGKHFAGFGSKIQSSDDCPAIYTLLSAKLLGDTNFLSCILSS